MSEFNFKVGDKITLAGWGEDACREIKCIGKELFFWVNQLGTEGSTAIKDYEWILWTDPNAIKKEEPEALWRIVTRYEEGGMFKEIACNGFLYTEEQIKARSKYVGFVQKIGNPWYFIDGKLVQKDEQRG